jgi:2-O-methyltransferase
VQRQIEILQGKFWRWVRPFHSPITRVLRKRLGREYFSHPEMKLPPAYEAVQLEVERQLHHYLHVPAEKIEQVVIVGANDGSEINRLKHSYPKSRFLCFEPSPQWFDALSRNFRTVDFVEARKLALSNSSGMATFHELPMAGNGSLLPPDLAKWSIFNQQEDNKVTAFQVQLSTLDVEAKSLERIDLLWIDVQGAEGQVLRGSFNTLHRVEAVFLEVALTDSPYQGALCFSQLDDLLKSFGFLCVGLGTDASNFSGNAFWIKNPAGRMPSISEKLSAVAQT